MNLDIYRENYTIFIDFYEERSSKEREPIFPLKNNF